MTIREQLEQREFDQLSPYAAHSAASVGREQPEDPCDVRTCYQRDRDRILYCRAFRRLKHKTQVFLAPAGDHYRTRLTHTLEVSQIARTIGKALYLNEDLIEAIALGHDLGHTPFGHAGERALNEVCPFGFSHNEQSLRVVEFVEKYGKGLNLTGETRDGILHHKTQGHPSTLEGKVVRLSDKIAYLHHDIDDATRAGILTEDMIPENIRGKLGSTSVKRLNFMVHDIITQSQGTDDIHMSEECEKNMMELRRFMFKHVYANPVAKKEESKSIRLVQMLYEHYMKCPEEMPKYLQIRCNEGKTEHIQAVCDYVAGMTDQYAIEKFEKINIPRCWRG